jgi:transcriptional regulator with XRE-family HTH domain
MTPTQIKAIRKGLNLTQGELAKAAEVHPKTVAYWERNEAPKASTPALKKMADALDRAGAKDALHNPRAAMLAAFEALPSEQQTQAALMVCAVANTYAGPT